MLKCPFQRIFGLKTNDETQVGEELFIGTAGKHNCANAMAMYVSPSPVEVLAVALLHRIQMFTYCKLLEGNILQENGAVCDFICFYVFHIHIFIHCNL